MSLQPVESAHQHGARRRLVRTLLADASGWNDVTERLQRQGFTVHAPANPLRGLQTDAASPSASPT